MRKITINNFLQAQLKCIFTKSFLLVFLSIIYISNLYGQFVKGNLIIEQVGDGVTALSSAASTVKLLQYTPSGISTSGTTFFGSSGTPTTPPFNIVESGSATSNGNLSLSTDSVFVVVTGYNAPIATASIAGSSSATYGRTIGKVTSNGILQTNGTFNTLSGNNYRSIVSNGSEYWLSGGAGIVYTPTDVTSNITTTCSSIFSTNTRILNIFNNTLFASTSSTSFNGTGSNLGIYQVGSFNSLPTSTVTAGTAVNIINTTTGSSPYGFAFSPDGLTCYIADDRATSAGGVQKWKYSGIFSTTTGWSGGSWALEYTLSTGVTNIGARALTVDFSSANPIIYSTSGETSLNRLFKITDTGSGSTASTLATASANYIYRGICFSPKSVPVISVDPTSIPTMVAKAGSEASETIEVSGHTLTGDISLAISGTDATLFSLSANSVANEDGAARPTMISITFRPIALGNFTAILTLSTAGGTNKIITLNGTSSEWTGVVNPNIKNIYATDGKIHLSTSAGQLIEVYNAVGQKLTSVLSKEGINTIKLSYKGIVLVKLGTEITKVVL